ncbi:N-acetyltransferase [Dysgonomonas sp. 216]|uniref:N-acetyltransferase n=1 Tax=Dysgonomonas sp. 216 TaxID=2302934 RepID=UPI0013D02E2B|nr:N-acetyltransferase [Dysgonomonas sp. 216]NDW19695.1 N-acetyltransferase [Dysgonomonas sp. 216]
MIRKMTDADIDAVMDIWLKTNIAAHDFIPENYWIGNFHAVKGEYLPKSENYVFESDGAIKAFISVVDNYFIGALFVSSDYQGQGVGQKLLDYCKDNYSRLEVAVYKDNIAAVGFYMKLDFVIKKEQMNIDSRYGEYIMEWGKN